MTSEVWQETVEVLGEHGIKVRVQHLRRWRVKTGVESLMSVGQFHSIDIPEHALTPGNVFELDPRGGITHLWLFRGEANAQEILADVHIRVHPNDNYCKRIGREKALSAALDVVKSRDPELRQQISSGRQQAAKA